MFRGKQREKTRVEKRVEKIPTADLNSWADQALYSIGRDLSQYQRNREAFRLEEAETSAEALLAVIREIRSRG